MAVLSSGTFSLLELSKRTAPDGTIPEIIENLAERYEFLADQIFIPGNLDTGHMAIVRTGIPEATWAKIGEYTIPQNSKTAQVTFNTGMLKEITEVPDDILKISAEPQRVLFSEEIGMLQGMNKTLASTVFYGNENTEPAEFTGLANYYNDLSAESADNIIDAKGTGSNNASIWLVGWSPQTISMIIPKNVPAGLQRETEGVVSSHNSDGGILRVHRTHYQQFAGLAVMDWKSGVRIANIDRGNLKADASGDSANLPELMFEACELLDSKGAVNPIFYMDRQVLTKLRQQLANALSSSTLTMERVGGIRTAVFQEEFPIRRVDALSVDEARVT